MAYIGENAVGVWANFRGCNVHLHDDYRVSSITDNGTGDYTVNYDVTLDNNKYAAVGSVGDEGGFSGGYNPERMVKFSNYTTTTIRFRVRSSTGGAADENACSYMLVGDIE